MTLQSIIQQQYSPNIQLSIGQVYAIGSAIRASAPGANVLVFGCGNDSGLWSRINFEGYTLLLENDPVWIDKIRNRYPDLNIVQVSYGDRTVANSLPIEEEALAAFPVPDCMLDRRWDVIIIDGPMGYKASVPGRSLSIYWSAKVARSETQIFLDDYDRKLERAYGDRFFRSTRPWGVEVPRLVYAGKPTNSTLLWVFGVDAKAQAAAMTARSAEVSAQAELRPDGRTSIPANAASPATSPDSVPVAAATDQAATPRRAIVCFVEDNKHVIQQALALRRSWVYSESADTDLVVMGPEPVLDRLPDDLVKIVQQPAADDPVWRGYRRVNSITCFNGAGAEELNRYTHIMRTDVDTFITPAWNQFYPTTFTYGTGGYANNDEVRQRLRDISAQYGLVHRGMTNVGSTWYGPTEVVRRTCAFAEMMAKHIITHHFATTQGKWPGWYRGVSVMYSGEIAVNHCAPEAQHSKLLEVPSASENAIFEFPHIHCWHTNKKFSKHWFMGGRYTREDAENLEMDVIRDYCMALSFQSLDDLAAVQPVSTRRFPGHPVPNGVAPRTSSVEWPRVVVGGHGNLGNNLFRTMSSVFLAAVLGARKLEGVHLPALGIATSVDGPLDDLFSIGGGHILPIDRILSSRTDAPHRGVVNTGYGQRFEYISGQRDFWRAQFDRLTVALPPLSDQEVVINIRAGEILKLLDRAYFPLPLDFYDVILEELGMAPVFVGQVNGDHPYLEKLRLRYPTARFIQGSALEDFELVRRSHTKILPISTFSWMAGWLGGDDSRVVMPVAGLFNPILQPQINLLPSDERFELRWFSPMKRDQAESSLDHFLEALSEASRGYPRVERSAYPVQDLGLSRFMDTRAVPTTPGEWSAFIESVILQQRQCSHRKVSS